MSRGLTNLRTTLDHAEWLLAGRPRFVFVSAPFAPGRQINDHGEDRLSLSNSRSPLAIDTSDALGIDVSNLPAR